MSKTSKGPAFRGGIGEMMRYATRIQQKLGAMKEEVKTRTVTASAAGDRVTAEVNGERKVVRITIDREKVGTEDLAELSDLITAAVNLALDKMDALIKEETHKVTGGVDLPGFF